MAALQTVKNARQITIDVVFGYFRLQNLNIPKGIKLICLKYYNENIEWFSGFREDCFKVSDDKMTITNIKNCDFDNHTIFGNVWIPSTSKTVSKWTLNITTNKMNDAMYIGFASKYDINDDFIKTHVDHTPNYAIGNAGFIFQNGEYVYSPQTPLAPKFREGSAVTLTLNLVDAQVRIKVDDQSDVVIADEIEINKHIRYIFAMQIRRIQNCVTLRNFENNW